MTDWGEISREISHGPCPACCLSAVGSPAASLLPEASVAVAGGSEGTKAGALADPMFSRYEIRALYSPTTMSRSPMIKKGHGIKTSRRTPPPSTVVVKIHEGGDII